MITLSIALAAVAGSCTVPETEVAIQAALPYEAFDSYFERATNAAASPEWRAYVAATLAFLQHDASALAASRAVYAAGAPGSKRLSIIDGFIACPHEPYARAVHCKM